MVSNTNNVGKESIPKDRLEQSKLRLNIYIIKKYTKHGATVHKE